MAAETDKLAVIETKAGKMVIEFFEKDAPKTVENFQKLAGKGFYDGTTFHRIIKGFMIQGGDPLSKDPNNGRVGTGDPGYKIKAEFNKNSHQLGVVSMARSQDPDSAGCQFFICLGDASFLDGQYTAFGKLVEGVEVLKKLGDTPTEGPERSRPTERVVIQSIKVMSRADALKK
ncbi:MAG: Peptidyl-prolyl cis-trans isomerase A [Verrucomicrobiae bacterium]|nr:Peptidyl-prolyl cis-trans isomerase A [Verrucomicrobiae bacterium]